MSEERIRALIFRSTDRAIRSKTKREQDFWFKIANRYLEKLTG